MHLSLPAVERSSVRFGLTDLRLFLHVAEAASITAGAMRRLDALPLHARQLVEHLRLVATARPTAR